MATTVLRLPSGDFSANAFGFYPGLVAQRLIRPTAIDPSVTVSRTHSPSGASAVRLDATGLLAEVAQNVPRFSGANQRLLVRPGRTYPNVNTRLDGAVIGSPGTVPTGYAAFGSTGITAQITAVGQEGSLNFVEVRFSGTASSTGRYYFAGPHIAAILGNQVTFAAYLQHVAGVVSDVASFAIGISEYSAVPGYLADSGMDVRGLITGAALRTQRFSHMRTMSNASAATARPWIGVTATIGAVVDFTVRFGWPSALKVPTIDLPALGPSGAPQDVTIGPDVPIWAPEGGVPAEGTLVAAYLVDLPAGSADQGLLQIDDGTDSNRLVLRNVAGGSSCDARVIAAGSVLATLALPTVVPGSLRRVAAAWDASGFSVVGTGGAVETYAGALPAGLVRGLAGHAASDGSRALTGEVETLHLHKTRLPAASLLAAVA